MTAAPEIPADVMAAARKLLPPKADYVTVSAAKLLIARAILAERQRCVDAVKAHSNTWSWSDDPEVCAVQTAVDDKADEIAAAIQGPTT